MLKAAALHGSPGALLVSRRSHTGTFARHDKCEARAPRSPNDAHVRRPAPRPLSRRSTCRVRAAVPRVHEARRYAALHAPRAPHLKHALRAARPRAARARCAGRARSARALSRARGALRATRRRARRGSAERGSLSSAREIVGRESPRSRSPARARARAGRRTRESARERVEARARRSRRRSTTGALPLRAPRIFAGHAAAHARRRPRSGRVRRVTAILTSRFSRPAEGGKQNTLWI